MSSNKQNQHIKTITGEIQTTWHLRTHFLFHQACFSSLAHVHTHMHARSLSRTPHLCCVCQRGLESWHGVCAGALPRSRWSNRRTHTAAALAAWRRFHGNWSTTNDRFKFQAHQQIYHWRKTQREQWAAPSVTLHKQLAGSKRNRPLWELCSCFHSALLFSLLRELSVSLVSTQQFLLYLNLP